MSKDVYTTPLADQDKSTVMNSVLWRLAVSAGLVERWTMEYQVDPDELLTEVERQLEHYHCMLAGGDCK